MKIIDTNATATVTMTNSLARLVADIRQYKTLTNEEETELCSEFKTADDARKEVIMRTLVNANMRFILSVAKKYSRDGDFVCELVSIGSIGFMKAIKDFDVTRGFRLISFAVHKIYAEFSEYFRTDANLVRRTNNAIIGGKDKKVAEKLYKENFREPTEEEIIEALESEYGLIVERADVVAVRATSLDSTVSSDDDACTVAENGEVAMVTATRNEYESEMDAEDMSDKTQRLLKGLSVREQDIICRKFGIGYDREYELDEIAEELGYTHERCRQLLKGALAKMKTRAVKIMAE